MAALLADSGFAICSSASLQPSARAAAWPGRDSGASQAKDARQSKSKAEGQDAAARRKPRPARDPPGFYMGRPIADVMSWQGADWLFRETRIEEEQPEAMLDALKIPRGATVADVGAGAGYHSIRLARRVGPKGTVFATDVQPEMLQMLQRQRPRGRRHQHQADPLHPARHQAPRGGGRPDPDGRRLPRMLRPRDRPFKGFSRPLKPGGRLVLVEFRGEDPDVPIKPEHKMTLDQVRREVEPQGFTFKESLEFLPWQHVIIFEKPAEAKADRPKTAPAPATKPGQPGGHAEEPVASSDRRVVGRRTKQRWLSAGELETTEYEFSISPSALDMSRPRPPSTGSASSSPRSRIEAKSGARTKITSWSRMSAASRRRFPPMCPQALPRTPATTGTSMIVADGMGGWPRATSPAGTPSRPESSLDQTVTQMGFQDQQERGARTV